MIGNGPYTREKLRQFNIILQIHLAITNCVIRKNRFNTNYLYIDCTSGPGRYSLNDGTEVNGSPLVFLENAKRENIPYRAFFIEEVQAYYLQLTQSISVHPWLNVNTYHGTYQDFVEMVFTRVDDNQLGLIYIDPNNGLPDLEILRHIGQYRPRMELLLNLSATNIKRTREITRIRLNDLINSTLKKVWLIRGTLPGDSHQWTFLLGSQWNGFASKWESINMYSIDSTKGKERLETLNYTREELECLYQAKMPLIEVTENTSNIQSL